MDINNYTKLDNAITIIMMDSHQTIKNNDDHYNDY